MLTVGYDSWARPHRMGLHITRLLRPCATLARLFRYAAFYLHLCGPARVPVPRTIRVVDLCEERKELYLSTHRFNKYLTCQLRAKSYKENHCLERDLL